jgi:hypothetical protein
MGTVLHGWIGLEFTKLVDQIVWLAYELKVVLVVVSCGAFTTNMTNFGLVKGTQVSLE